MKTNLIRFIAVFLFCLQLQAQTVDEIKLNSQKYLWGEGKGVSLQQADKEALAMLISQISVQVESSTQLTANERIEDDKHDYSQTFKSAIETYSKATVRNTERIVLANEPDAWVFRYIERKEISKIFRERKQKVDDFIDLALEAEKKNRVATALRYYYWAYVLLQSHPEANSLQHTNDEGVLQNLASWLPFRINELFSNISIRVDDIVQKDKYSQINLQVYYKTKRAANYDFSYWTGRDWSRIMSCKDGVGFAEIPGSELPEAIRIKTEYEFQHESLIDNELHEVMNKVAPIPFRGAYLNIPLAKPTNENLSTLTAILPATKAADALSAISVIDGDESLNATCLKLEQAISQNNYSDAQSLFTETGYQIYQSLVAYGQAKMAGKAQWQYISHGNGVICRGLPLSFYFPNNNKTFVENLVFNVNQSGKIDNISFALSDQALYDIIGNTAWSQQVRLELVNFLENYKTAYALKRLDYIERIFDDDALIIIGRLLEADLGVENNYRNSPVVRYNQYSKQQYIQNLRHVFNSNEFINIRFEDNVIRKSGKGGEIYGIQIKQNYFSANYGDSGYLFLLLDLNDTAKPLIHVRTWQPQKNDDGSIYGLKDF
ncbi:MAG: LPP20 family lipoprotein [Bacteroidales bacterium]|nr:LPP20 family lipoprotein [Bacteroidales bacterium]